MDALHYLGLLVSILLIVYQHIRRNKIQPKNLPPSPPSLPIIGHFHLLKLPMSQTLTNLCNKYGPILLLQVGSRPTLVVSSRSAIEECLTKNDIIFANRPLLPSRGQEKEKIFTSIGAPYGEHWRNLRRVYALEIFSPRRLLLSANIRTEEIRFMAKHLFQSSFKDVQKVDVKSLLYKLDFNIVIRMVAGKRCFEEDEMNTDIAKDKLDELNQTFTPLTPTALGDYFPFLRWFTFYGAEQKIRKLRRKRDDFAQALLDEQRKADRKIVPTLIDSLLKLQESEPEFCNDNVIKGIVQALLLAGPHTSIPGLDKGKGMYFLFIKSEAKTPGGLVARPVLTSYYKSCHFKERPYDPYTNYTSPNETILCPDSYQSMYSQLLCGLCQNKEVLRVGAVFASGFIRAIRFLEKHWPLVVKDIRTGTIDSQITDPSVRDAVMKILKPNPKLAGFIENECRKDCWQGIITRLWPNTKYVDVIVTGTMSQYIPILDYYSNGLPLVCTMYASSECYFGVNLNPLCKPSEVSYTLVPTMAYFEFLPVHRNNGVANSISMPKSLNEKERQELVDLVDVKLGQEYELVVTTYAGLYRYRVGDVLRVAGFKNKAPQFNFICRKNVVLSIDSDKTDEVELQNAVKNAVNHLVPFDAAVSEYTSYADTTTVPGHYVLYWELSLSRTTPIPPSVFEDCCLTIEESLNSVYRQGRVCDKSIGPLEIKIVEPGTFDKLMDYAISLGASINQYKTPRCVKFAPIIELLNSRVVSNYFSPKCPKWVAGHKQWSSNNNKATTRIEEMNGKAQTV